jgi:hypothetical protein
MVAAQRTETSRSHRWTKDRDFIVFSATRHFRSASSTGHPAVECVRTLQRRGAAAVLLGCTELAAVGYTTSMPGPTGPGDRGLPRRLGNHGPRWYFDARIQRIQA